MKYLLIIFILLLHIKAYGIANPASENCVKLGGTLKIVTSKEGQYGNCVIEKKLLLRALKSSQLKKVSFQCSDVNGTNVCVIEEWALMKAMEAN